MTKKLEKRVCVACNTVWYVQVKNTVQHPRCLCDNCIKTLSKLEKQHYYKLHEGKAILDKRVCLHCGKEWYVTTSKIEKTDADKKHYFCSNCCKILTPTNRKQIMKNFREGYKKKLYEEKRKSRLRNIQQELLNRARKRAQKHNLDFNLTKEDIIIPEVCPILEVPIVFGVKDDYEYSPSIDRIDNSKGYVKGNICIISKKANSMKNSASIKELKAFCKNILRYSLNITESECNEVEDKELLR